MDEVQSKLEGMVSGRPAPLMTAIMPSVDASQPHIVISTPPPGSGSQPSAPGLFSGSTARYPDADAPAPVADKSSTSGRVPVPGGTLVMPAANPATMTHSTTMSDSAAEVGSGGVATKTLSSRRRPAVLGAAIAGIGVVVVAIAMLMRPSTPAMPPVVATPTPAVTPPPAPPPPVAAPTEPTKTAHETPPSGETPKEPKEEPKIDLPPRPVVVEVSSDPTGAEVWLPSDTEARGHTPFKVALDPKAAPTHVVLKAHGYSDKGFDIDPGKPEPMSLKLERAVVRDHGPKKKTTEPGEVKPVKVGDVKPVKDGYRRMGD
jgi:hypothetical protein